MKRSLVLSSLFAFALSAEAVPARIEAPVGNVRLRGYVGDRLKGCVRHHVAETDVGYLTDVFDTRVDGSLWRSEFWGKYMHSAAPFWTLTGCERLRKAMDASVKRVLAAQQPDGYIGDYREGIRSDKGWDVWGNKYTLLGLLHYYEATGDKAALAGARRLADYLETRFLSGGKSLRKTGFFRGMPSGSVLEPIVWLHRVTGEAKDLAFAKKIVEELDAEDGARLLRDASVPVGRRVTDGTFGGSTLKAYEMMSCYQGMLELYDVTGERRLLDAALASAESIRTTEINIAGGAASSEFWYGGANRQTETYVCQQETCVLTTWMRLCGKLLAETGDAKWADEIERTFYNAYLGTLAPENDVFSQYSVLTGTRSRGAYHCRMHTNCCNANGPRGFLVFLKSLLLASGDAAYLNFYASGDARVRVGDGELSMEVFTLYPAEGTVNVRLRRAPEKPVALSLRVPAWCRKCGVKLNGKDAEGVREGGYVTIRRPWKAGDELEISFETPVVVHKLDEHVALTRGPLVLARDRRFGDGDFSETLRRTILAADTLPGESVAPEKGLWTTVACALPLGSHLDNPEMRRPRMVRFCDYASAGNTWSQDSFYRVWLPVEREAKSKP